MHAILRLLPQSLAERIFALYGIGLLTFVLAGLGAYYYYQFHTAIDQAHESAALVSEIIAPTITDSAIIGDYDTVQRTLDKVLLRSEYASAMFIDLRGGIVRAESTRIGETEAPSWIYVLVTRQLSDVNRNISAGGRDYGVLRLKFSASHIAAEIWSLTRIAMIVGAASLMFGSILIRTSLRRWLGDLERMQEYEWGSQSGLTNPQALLSHDAPTEIRQTFDVLNRTAARLQLQRARADVTLAAIADGVITADKNGLIVYINPVATRLFMKGTDALLGRHLRDALPPGIAGKLDNLPESSATNWRIELDSSQDSRRILDFGWSPIFDADHQTAGHVLTFRDVTESHLLEQKLRIELDSRKAALDALHEVVKGLQKSGDTQVTSSDDISALSRYIAELSLERARVTALLEDSVRELGYQKFALDAHSIVSITDAAATITYANQKFAETSGYAVEELLGQHHRIVKSGMHPEDFYRNIWKTISSGEVWHGQIANRRKNGGIYWVASTIVPWLDDHGVPYQYISIHTDITEQKNIEHALEEAQRRELEIGTGIQRSLLQGEVPQNMEGAWLACSTEPSQGIDGDFYSIRSYRPSCFEILVGDVMGKGVPAALIGAGIKTTYNEVLADLLAARIGHGDLPTPSQIINRLHQALTPRLIELASFATLALYRFDLAAGTLTYVNAGHTPGLLARVGEPRVQSVFGDNLPIGIIAEEIYQEASIPIGPGDSLLVFSDGITEARNADAAEFGVERLSALLLKGRAAAVPPAALLLAIRQAIHSFAGDNRQTDDRTALLVEMHPDRPGSGSSLNEDNAAAGIPGQALFSLPWDLAAMAQLRARIREVAAPLPEADCNALILAAHEAATNIIRHAQQTLGNPMLVCRVRWQGDALVVELFHPGAPFIPPQRSEPDFSGNRDGGFGLYIIEASADQVEYLNPLPGINVIRLTQHRSRAPAANLAPSGGADHDIV